MPTGARQASCCWDRQGQGLGAPKPAHQEEIPVGTADPGTKHSAGGGLGVAGLCQPPAVVVMGKGGTWCGHAALNVEVKPVAVSGASMALLLCAH